MTILHVGLLTIHVVRAQLLREWRKEINPNIDKTNIVVTLYHKIGNKKGFTLITIGYLIAMTIPQIIIAILFYNDVNKHYRFEATIQGTFLGISLCWIVYCLHKMIVFNDTYYVGKEGKLLSILQLPLFVSGIFLSIFLDSKLHFVVISTVLVVAEMNNICVILLYPLLKIAAHKNEFHLINVNEIRDRLRVLSKSSKLSRSGVAPNSPSADDDIDNGHDNNDNTIPKKRENKTRSLMNIISDANQFEAFANHLNKEFACENLLFIVYIIQYQNYLINKKIIDKDCKDLIFITNNWKLPQNVPQSPLFVDNININNNVDENKSDVAPPVSVSPTIKTKKKGDSSVSIIESMKNGDKKNIMIFEFLFKKFLQRGWANLEINISDLRREALHKHYNNIKEAKEKNFDVEQVWKDLILAACEIWVLLGYNQTRFRMPTIGKRISTNVQ